MAEKINLKIEGNRLMVGGQVLFNDLSPHCEPIPDPLNGGLFLHLTGSTAGARLVLELGQLSGVRRFTALHRYEPFWMRACAGQRGGEVPVETQFLLAELEPGGSYAALVPLVDGVFRASLEGFGQDGLAVVFESGDPALVGRGGTVLFAAAGEDPYQLMESAAVSVAAHLKTGRLRREKTLPGFMDEFGWCTWDAFYQDVTPDKVRLGLESFRAGGIALRMLLLDDGWQSEEKFGEGGRRLTAFEANAKFPGGLKPTVDMAKQEFGVRHFLVWHAFSGYWDGVDPASFPQYRVEERPRIYSPGILHHVPQIGNFWGKRMGVVAPEDMYRFYQDYHRYLRREGVDGIKVDNQAVIETVAEGFGGRVAIMQRYHEALEGSAHTQFQGELINCMSCANEMLYSALNSNLTRTSTDFWPKRPETHGEHLYFNAQVGLWFGQFIYPDWDMFQSGHPQGAYHAAGRAVSGAPVYVSDKLDGHDFALLRKLVLPDGGVLRARQPGLPTRDCLLNDPTREDVLLKIFNVNEGAGVVGVFNARYDPSAGAERVISGAVRPADVEGLAGEQFIIYAHGTGEARQLGREETWPVSLAQLTAEVFTIVPLDRGVAPLGLIEMFNSGGAVLAKGWQDAQTYTLQARGPGRFALWCEHPPRQALLGGSTLDLRWSSTTHLAEFLMPDSGEVTLHF